MKLNEVTADSVLQANSNKSYIIKCKQDNDTSWNNITFDNSDITISNSKVLTLDNLDFYDERIKIYIKEEIAKAIKNINNNSDNDYYKRVL